MSGTELSGQSKHFLPMFMAAVIGAALSIGGGLFVSQWEDRVAIQEFQTVAENQSGILQNGINQYLSRLVALRALFESSRDEVSRRQFEIFAERTLRDQTAIQSVSWIPRVSHAERATRERSAIDERCEVVRHWRRKKARCRSGGARGGQIGTDEPAAESDARSGKLGTALARHTRDRRVHETIAEEPSRRFAR